MGLIWSDNLLEEARRRRDEVAAELRALGVTGDVELTGASGIPGALTKGDVDLHLRVPPHRFSDTVRLLRSAYPVASRQSWGETLAVFDIPRDRATGLAVTPVGSEHDVRFVSTWREIRRRPELLREYNQLKESAWRTKSYEDRKSAFFSSVSDEAGRP